MDEFALIERYFASLTAESDDVALGIGDDGAVLRVGEGEELVVTTDTLVAGRHFPDKTDPFDIGWKSLAVNLSDLAAMGARPRWFTLALTLPAVDEAWVESFASGLQTLALQADVDLVGGDTTRGPLSITLTAMGVLPKDSALRRDGAKAGDLICVTGTLGDAALALSRPGKAEETALLQRLNRPEPRVAAGQSLRGLAHAAIDLSDGLAGDLNHILKASRLGAVVESDKLPASEAFSALAPAASRLALQAQGGDDYELCVCLPPQNLAEAQRALDVPLTVIGCITEQPGLRFTGRDGRVIALEPRGYQHF